MNGKLIDIVEDIGKGLNMEQLAQKPTGKEQQTNEQSRVHGASTRENA